MTFEEYDLIKEMLDMQEKLDEAIMKGYGLFYIDEEKLSFAILDEVGELTHELKANWCWWKKTQAPVDDNKVLGELVDIWHFVLSWQNNFNGGEARIQVTDDKGNLKSESYLEDPYSGVGYVIIHDISNSTDSCLIATNLDEIQGCYIYTSKQEAIDAWNKRVNDNSNEEKEND